LFLIELSIIFKFVLLGMPTKLDDGIKYQINLHG
jgi:hypothetical protein